MKKILADIKILVLLYNTQFNILHLQFMNISNLEFPPLQLHNKLFSNLRYYAPQYNSGS